VPTPAPCRVAATCRRGATGGLTDGQCSTVAGAAKSVGPAAQGQLGALQQCRSGSLLPQQEPSRSRMEAPAKPPTCLLRGLKRLLPLPCANTTMPQAPWGTARVPPSETRPSLATTSQGGTAGAGRGGGRPGASVCWPGACRASGAPARVQDHSVVLDRPRRAGRLMLVRRIRPKAAPRTFWHRHVLASRRCRHCSSRGGRRAPAHSAALLLHRPSRGGGSRRLGRPLLLLARALPRLRAALPAMAGSGGGASCGAALALLAQARPPQQLRHLLVAGLREILVPLPDGAEDLRLQQAQHAVHVLRQAAHSGGRADGHGDVDAPGAQLLDRPGCRRAMAGRAGGRRAGERVWQGDRSWGRAR
jgi:hypothetical protein